jgi:hypothetical protein
MASDTVSSKRDQPAGLLLSGGARLWDPRLGAEGLSASTRCVSCMQCGAASPGFHCEWQNSYTHCGPCASLVTCPVCHAPYVEEDLLIQCRHCER